MLNFEEEILKHIYKKIECPECGKEMNETGVCFLTFPPQYEYECSECSTKIKVRK